MTEALADRYRELTGEDCECGVFIDNVCGPSFPRDNGSGWGGFWQNQIPKSLEPLWPDLSVDAKLLVLYFALDRSSLVGED